MRVLLTGGHGFVGTHVCRELLGSGCQVQVLCRRALEGRPEAGLAAASVGIADLRDETSVNRVLQSFAPDSVVHLAAHIASPAPDGTEDWRVFEVNSQGTANLLHACAKLHPSPTVIYTSTMSVYDYEHPQYLPVDERHPVGAATAYGLSKYFAEMLCRYYARSRSADFAVLRLPGVYGPGRHTGLIYNLLVSGPRGKVVRVASLEARRDFIYVKDVARAVRLAIRVVQQGRSMLVNLSGGDIPNVAGLAKIAYSVVGHEPVICENESAARSGFWFDPATAETELGFRSRSVKEALEDFWASLN